MNIWLGLSDGPNVIGNPLPAGFHQTVQEWFDKTAFDFSGTCPAPGLITLTHPFNVTKAFENAPRYFSNIRNPGVDNFDFSMQKDFRIPVRLNWLRISEPKYCFATSA